jgi:SAM-dependent methyltransferase
MADVPVSEYFDRQYGATERYWWKAENRYDTDPDTYTRSLLTQLTLRLVRGRPPGRVLDLGAGEGADSIRLAGLGHQVDAVEISAVAAGKIARFAGEAGVDVGVTVADVTAYRPAGLYDLIICNGVLHYVEDKEAVIRMMQNATAPGGLNVISCWSTWSAIPEYHNRVATHPDDEDGVIVKLYKDWVKEIQYFDRDKPETAHSDLPPHAHSHIKLIARKPEP